MSKTKADYINDLVQLAFRMDEKAERTKQRTRDFNRMSSLARSGEKDSEEFKELERKFAQPMVTDFSNELNEVQKIVSKLRKYKF